MLSIKLKVFESQADSSTTTAAQEKANLQAKLEQKREKMKNAKAELAEAKRKEDEMT